jgi:hypothetical protein
MLFFCKSSLHKHLDKAVELSPQLIPPAQGHSPQYVEEIQVDLLPLYIPSYAYSSDNYTHPAEDAACPKYLCLQNKGDCRQQTARFKHGSIYD